METANHHCSNIILCSLVKSKNVLISSCNHSLPNCMHYNVLFTYLILIFTYNSGRSRSQPGGGGGGGGVRGPSGGRYGRGSPSYWWGFRGSHSERMLKKWSKTVQSGVQSQAFVTHSNFAVSPVILHKIYLYIAKKYPWYYYIVSDGWTQKRGF